MVSISITRIAFYIFLGVLGLTHNLPLWVGPAWILFDAHVIFTYKSKGYKRLEEETVKNFYARLANADGPELPEPSGEKWN